MKFKNKTFLYPIAIIFIVFLLDKIVFIPAIQKCCVELGIRDFYIETEKSKQAKFEKFKNAKDSGKKIILTLGSSISYGFYFKENENFIINNELVSNKSFLKNYEIINYSNPGISALSYYIII
ncbi:MAG: DUF1574 family protein, partial [Leptospiraceae bacterium]|nr:DUF1574 family protein [Leptospiraceae bacterium]